VGVGTGRRPLDLHIGNVTESWGKEKGWKRGPFFGGRVVVLYRWDPIGTLIAGAVLIAELAGRVRGAAERPRREGAISRAPLDPRKAGWSGNSMIGRAGVHKQTAEVKTWGRRVVLFDGGAWRGFVLFAGRPVGGPLNRCWKGRGKGGGGRAAKLTFGPGGALLAPGDI